ncbi:MAG: hypothetical protein H0X17_13905 [Deltaproteobacteria bacterium]|nr:hypothetical protein [Deltaproteobacteria bacterium]
MDLFKHRLALPGSFAVIVAAVVATGCVAGEEELEGDENFEVTDDDLVEDDAFEQAAGDGKEDGVLTYAAVARLAKHAGLACTGERIAIAVAVAKAESGFRPTITNTVGNAHGIDRGLWQINSYWHPNVSATCAFSPSCNARAMASISSKGTKWSPWWTYVNKKHVPFMPQARAAQSAVCAE